MKKGGKFKIEFVFYTEGVLEEMENNEQVRIKKNNGLSENLCLNRC